MSTSKKNSAIFFLSKITSLRYVLRNVLDDSNQAENSNERENAVTTTFFLDRHVCKL